MGIHFDKDRKIFTINTDNSTYQFMVDRYGYLLHLYYGSRINGSAEYLLQYYDRGFSGSPCNAGSDKTYSMDVLPREMPVWGNGDFRSPSLVVETEDGARGAVFMYESHEIRDGKYSLPGLPAVYADDAKACRAETLEILLKDPVLGLELRMLYGVLPELDVITRAVSISNAGGSKVYLDKALSASIDFITGDYDLITFHGRHMMERNVCRTHIGEVGQIIGSRRGTSSHQYNPFVIVARQDAGESTGDCYAMELVYSGGFQAEAEKDQFGATRVQMGIQEAGFHYSVAPGETFYTPEVVLAYSEEGTDALSKKLHDLIRDHLCRDPYKGRSKPVVINSWEGAYMDIDHDYLIRLAKNARELGIDMLVVDDGWFGKRDDDNSSLGDWVANESKLGCSLSRLIEDVNAEGIRFGIWLEPEMVSEDSDLYRAHPDWAMKLPGREPVRGRNQLVLDLANGQVRKYILESICSVLDSGNIEYVKWDYNRSIYEFYSSGADHQGRVLHDYVLGLYEILEQLHEKYPKLLIEGCSGGGGRFDLGMLYYTPQIWTSDNTDPVDRLWIQYGTSFGYPPAVMAAHVSKSPNENTGRQTPVGTRGVVAMYGAFGYEMDLTGMPEEEKEAAKKQVRDYKRFEPLIREGDYYRLSDPDRENYCAWGFVSKNQKEALIHAVVTRMRGNGPVNYMKVKGLKKGASYVEKNTGITYDADLLMSAGLPLPREAEEYAAYQFHFVMEEPQQ